MPRQQSPKDDLARRLEDCQFSLPQRRSTSRPVGSMKFGLAGLFLFLTMMVGQALAFDPPRIIGVLTSPQEDQQGFATSFCWVGDQNVDGYDDLVVNQDLFPNDTLSKVYLFQGGDSISNQPAFTWSSYAEGLSIGRKLQFIGHHANNFDRLAMLSVKRVDAFTAIIAVDQYILGNGAGNNPVIGMSAYSRGGSTTISPISYADKPKDWNGDGFADFFFIKQNPPTPRLQVCYGGENADTLPDWETDPQVSMGLSADARISGGYDINGDHFDDMLVYTRGDTDYYSLYLGGNPPDTFPALRIAAYEYRLGDVFAMLTDVNGDGFDDWGISWRIGGEVEVPNHGGIKIFFGGEELDSEPDLTFEAEPLRGLGIGGLCGGDFNGDGVGDVVFVDGGGINQPVGRMSVHFGNRWIEDNHQPDIYISNMMRQYGYESSYKLGAVGDYNGDNTDDFVAFLSTYDEDHYVARGLVIFAGNREWHLIAPKEKTLPTVLELKMSVSPNPFNQSTSIQYSTSPINREATSLRVYDLSGREVVDLLEGQTSSVNPLRLTGKTTADHRGSAEVSTVGCGDPTVGGVVWDAADFTAGIYFVRLEAGNKTATKKMLLVK